MNPPPTIECQNGLQLTEKIGDGSYGSVWKAFDQQLQRNVAVKVLHPDKSSQLDRARFAAEARIAARLNHPGIVRVYRFDEAESKLGSPYIVSEFVAGVSLREWLEFCSLDFVELADLFGKISDAVAHAHDNGVVHRDLKPENILIDISGNPFITDFGLAKDEGISITIGNIALGTVAYMSPEQASGKNGEVSAQSDLYSIGVMLYEALTHSLPHAATTIAAYLNELSNNHVTPVRRKKADVPIDLATICDACLEKDPGRRLPSAAKLRDELLRYCRGEPIRSRLVSGIRRAFDQLRRQGQSQVAMGLLVAGLMSVVLVGIIYNGTSPNHPTGTLTSAKGIHSEVAAIISASPNDLGNLLKNLESLDEDSKAAITSRLFEKLDSENPVWAIHAALALQHLDQDCSELLIDRIDSVPDEEGRLYVQSLLRNGRNQFLSDAQSRWESNQGEPLQSRSIRRAIVALHLGEPSFAGQIVDCSERAEGLPDFVRHYAKWHGRAEELDWLFDRVDVNGDLLYAICLAIGIMDDSEQAEFSTFLDSCYRQSEDRGCQVAAQWARKDGIGQLTAPAADASLSIDDVLVFIEVGSQSAESVRLERESMPSNQRFLITQTEVSQLAYSMFEAEHQFSAPAGPRLPAHTLSFGQMAKFCNWLSDQKGLDRVYRLVDPSAADNYSSWLTDFSASGFRLPTVSEWQASSRGYSVGDWPSEEAIDALRLFAVFREINDGLQDGGLVMPNRLGIFDSFGNAAEVCHHISESRTILAWCGGHALSRAEACCQTAVFDWDQKPWPLIGFRVVRK